MMGIATKTDFDAPRNTADVETESLEVLQARRSDVLVDDTEAEGYELPDLEVIDEELAVPVIPVRSDEFRCGSCFLVRHRSQHAGTRQGHDVCYECA